MVSGGNEAADDHAMAVEGVLMIDTNQACRMESLRGTINHESQSDSNGENE